MTEPVIAKKGPFAQVLEAGSYWWCACGRSKNQPYCDGSHKGTGFSPRELKLEQKTEVWLCGCKHSGHAPHCDGSHKQFIPPPGKS